MNAGVEFCRVSAAAITLSGFASVRAASSSGVAGSAGPPRASTAASNARRTVNLQGLLFAWAGAVLALTLTCGLQLPAVSPPESAESVPWRSQILLGAQVSLTSLDSEYDACCFTSALCEGQPAHFVVRLPLFNPKFEPFTVQNALRMMGRLARPLSALRLTANSFLPASGSPSLHALGVLLLH